MIRNRSIIQASLLIILFYSFTACQKAGVDEIQGNLTNSGSGTGTTSSSEQVKDSALLNARDVYLWATQIPATFNAQSYTDPNAIMEGIRAYSMESGFSTAVDRWSFAMKKTEWDQLSGGVSTLADASTTAGDLGISVFFRSESDLRVKMIEPNSPAGSAGIKRGWRILSINGNTSISSSNTQFIINTIYNGTSATVNFQKPDGSTASIDLVAAHYNTKPVYLDSVYNVNGSNVGYLVYTSFLGNINQTYSEFAKVFNKFAAANVKDVIIDLRYNGGGYVQLQSQLANYLINSSNSGQLMMKQLYNANNSSNNETTNFQKAGGLNANKIYFIVSSSTASASELLINNLKPYMDVRLIGTGNTHGKPVGFFSIPVGDWYEFPVSFKTVNKNGEGNYYNGFTPNALVADGLDKDWGDVTEASLASALRNIAGGAYRGGTEPTYQEEPEVTSGNAKLDAVTLKVTVDKK